MSKVRERVGPRGLQIPKAVLEESGIYEGMPVIIEPAGGVLRVVPEEVNLAVIRKAALRYLLHHVGDAVDVGVAHRVGSRWEVEVLLPHKQTALGVLRHTGDGVLLPEESTTPSEMIRKAHEA